MLSFATLTLGADIAIAATGMLLLQVVAAVAVATYGANRGVSYMPLLLCGLFMPWPLVLLGIVITEPRSERRFERMGWAAERVERERLASMPRH